MFKWILFGPTFLLSVGMYLASHPFYDKLKERILINAVAVGGLYGVIGTMLMGQPGYGVPINAVYGALASLIVTTMLFMIEKAWKKMRVARSTHSDAVQHLNLPSAPRPRSSPGASRA